MSRDFLNSVTKNAESYTPGEQVNEPGWIKLNTNESPLLPSPAVFKAMAALVGEGDILRKYSHPLGEPLLTALARYWNVDKEKLMVTNGSDEALALVCRATLSHERTAAFSAVTYSLYRTLVANAGSRYTEIAFVEKKNQPYGVDYQALDNSSASVIFLANPNAITGEFIARDSLAAIIQKSDKLWVVDEAYNDFAGLGSSMMDYLGSLDNLIVTRTFSKTHALAGLRVGYLATGNATVMRGLMAHKDSYNEDALATRLASAALADTAWHGNILRAVAEGRAYLREELTKLQFSVYDSAANFVLAKAPPTKSAAAIVKALRAYKLLVRHYPNSIFADCVRISVGSESENAKLIGALKEIIG